MTGRDKKSFSDSIPCAGVFVRREFWLVPLLVLLTALGAHLRFYLAGTPVPVTMQTFFVLIAGGVGGTLAGPLSQTLYLTLGLCGIPFFAALVPAGPLSSSLTLGYLIGFIVASGFMGIRNRRHYGLLAWIFKGTVATAIIYMCGLSWIMIQTTGDFTSALVMGVIPFLPWDLFKVILAALVIVRFKERR